MMGILGFKNSVKRAFTHGLQGDGLPGGTSAPFDIHQKPLGLKAVGFDGDNLSPEVVSHGVAACGFNTPGFERDGGPFVMRDGFKGDGLAVAGVISGEDRERGGEHEYYGNEAFHEVSIS